MKRLPRRQFLHLAAGVAFPAGSGIARAQTYPTRPITIIAPFAVGGTTDLIGRIIAERMRAALGQPVIVENGTLWPMQQCVPGSPNKAWRPSLASSRRRKRSARCKEPTSRNGGH
jgi:hypothetical protein